MTWKVMEKTRRRIRLMLDMFSGFMAFTMA